MAAAATTVVVTKAGILEPQPWSTGDTTGWVAPNASPLKFAIVACTQDGGDYATAGQAVDILGALDNYGWSAIYYGRSLPYTTNSVLSEAMVNDPNNATPANRKVIWQLTTTGAQLAATAGTAGTFYMYVVGI